MGQFFDTAGTILNDAATELGLINSALTDPVASTDPNMARLVGMLKKASRDLRRKREWRHLRQQTSFVTVANQGLYPIPQDIDMVINETAWNRTNRLPLGGPLTAQEFAYLRARLVGVVFTVLWDPMQQQVRLYPDTNTPGGYTIAYEYRSRWAVSAPIPVWAAGQVYQPIGLGTIPAVATNPIQSLTTNPSQAPGNYYFTLLGGTTQAVGGSPPKQQDNTVWPSDNGVTDWRLAPPWAPNTAYGGGGAQFNYVLSNGQIYQATTAGTSSAGNPPFGTGRMIDGTVTWTWVGPGAIAAAGTGLSQQAQAIPRAETVTQSKDLVLFDPNLVVRQIILDFKRAAGLDAVSALDDYEEALSDAMDTDATAPVLNLDRGHVQEPLISERNVPITGFGT